ncbi:MAG: hypothetical protein E6R04_09235 [Spirochaetes bacterium]|nr:MAG: hypothetical protein E6R04_09235 [Spirochaetota bacterium]
MTYTGNLKPQPVTDVTLAFPASVMMLMPKYEDIPEEFRDRNSSSKWIQFQRDWFFKGLKVSGLIPKKGIDLDTALRQLQAIQGSYEPKHEHKEACVAYLASLWFEESSTW